MLRGGRRDQVGRVLPPQPDRERERGPPPSGSAASRASSSCPWGVSSTVGSVFIAMRLVETVVPA